EVAARWGDDGRALALWTRVTRLAPHDERALRGLAEAQLALGRHADAVSTWRRLCARDGRGPEARLRLVELLLEHDFVDEARTALPPLEGPLARSTRAARLSAEILERQGKMGDATRAWQAVIANARGDDQADERREARARLLALLARGDRAGLDALVRTLADEARAHPGDRERALFLAEARQRAGDEAGAIAGLRALLDGAPAPEATTVDVTFALVRLLRGRGGNGDEALRRLEALARRFPARAREAHVLMADLGMARHDEGAALAHAEEAARLAPDDGEALARVAAIEERAGDDAAATATYRRALALDPGGPSGLALAHLLTRAGDGDGASRVLHTLLETSNDDDVLLEAGRAALAVDEYTNRLPELARLVAAAPRGGARAEATRRLLADVLARVAPTLAREAFFDAEARDSLAHLGRAGAGAVLALVTEAGIDPDRRDVELLGWLGQTDAAPVLARLAAPPPDGPRDEAEPTRPVAKDVQLAALVALGRLADPRGRDALAALALSGEPRLRAAAIWALGRLGDARDAATLTHAARDARPDLAGLACLGLGRTKSSRAVELLTSLAVDAERPTLVRRAAIAGLAFARDRTATPALLTLASSGDDALEQAALIALSATRDARAFSLVLARAARDGAAGPGGRALGLWVAGGALPDEAVAVDGPRLDLEALLDALTPPPTSSVPPAAWTPWARDLASALDDVLAAGGDPRAAALAALAEGGEALGLGALAAPDDTTPALATARAVIGTRIRPRLVALSGDEDPAVRLPARRALAKIDRSAHP
ncbi:MAG TPA: HEAT repeat domain-containing protein, partial [Polyangia bacterium]|nr:HEAT repeat domain-containing protein [Polyangia bacterium]